MFQARIKFPTLLLIALSAISVVATGCSRRTDNPEQLVAHVQNVLRSDSRLAMARLQVTCAHGIVTLRGYVVNNAQRATAVKDARSVEGVKVVVDNLRLIESSRLVVMAPKTTASAEKAEKPMVADRK